MIKLFKRDSMEHTPFVAPQSIRRLERAGIGFTNRAWQCDIVLARFYRKLRRYRLMYPWKGFLLWTHEPRFNTHFYQQMPGPLGLANVEIMNIYTRDVFCKNYDVYGGAIDHFKPALTEDTFPNFRHKKIVVIATCKTKSLMYQGRDIDLFGLRTRIALAGHQLGKVDVFGRKWPAGVSIEDSRGSGWHRRKPEILRNYHFNLCFENTTFENYCTEKIWDSIRAGCLPIYFGQGNTIYDDFPRDSFLDYSEFDSPEALFDYIDRMTPAEFRERMNRCITAFNRAFSKRRAITYYDGSYSEDLLERIIRRIQAIAERRSTADSLQAAA